VLQRPIESARARVKDSHITQEVLGEILPGQCRLALEAALREPAQRKLLSARLGHTEIDERIAKAHQLTELAALALFGTNREKRGVYEELERRVCAESTRVVELCNKGAHSTIMDAQAGHFIKRAAEAAESLRAL
jgi:hypothetical protein